MLVGCSIFRLCVVRLSSKASVNPRMVTVRAVSFM